MNNEIENIKKKLIYRSQYRGTKEMDNLISSFVKYYISNLNIKDLTDLESLLNVDDDTLYKFYTNQINKKRLPNNKVTNLFKNFEIK